VGDEVNPERPSQSPRRNRTIKVTISSHLFAPCLPAVGRRYALCALPLQAPNFFNFNPLANINGITSLAGNLPN
jgi:hypothetical protein